jgi:ABC-type amino acid transport substrate-binding protein
MNPPSFRDARAAARRWSLRTLVLLLLLPVLGCSATHESSSEPEPTPGPPPFRVGISSNVPPFAFEEGGRYVGIEVDLAKQLAGALGMRARFVELPWDDLIPALLDHRVDIIMSGMTITEPRQVRAFFTKPYLESSLAILARRGEDAKFASLEAIKRSGAKIGVTRGTTGETFVRERFPSATVYAYPTADDAVADLRARRIDVYFGNAPTLAWLVSQYEAELAVSVKHLPQREPIGWAVRKTDPDLQEAVSALLADWQKDGTLQLVLDRWLPSLSSEKPADKQRGDLH